MNPRPSRRTISLRAAGVSALLTAVGAAALCPAHDRDRLRSQREHLARVGADLHLGGERPERLADCADGTKVSDDCQNRTTYTLSSPATLLVIKAATWNFIWNNRAAGVYGSPVAPDGKVHAISHVIVCGVVTATPTASATASES